jgi:hypothetical protein
MKFILFCFRFFRFVSKQFCLFRLFRNGFETPKQTETNRKNYFLVSRNKPKINRNRLCFGLFRFEPKKFFVCFEDTLLRIRVKIFVWRLWLLPYSINVKNVKNCCDILKKSLCWIWGLKPDRSWIHIVLQLRLYQKIMGPPATQNWLLTAYVSMYTI